MTTDTNQPPVAPTDRKQEILHPPLVTGPLPNYSLSTVCPQCGATTIRRACKVRCERCGFMWDCSEL